MFSFKQYIESKKPMNYRPRDGQEEALRNWIEENANHIIGRRIHMSYEGVGEITDVPQIVEPGYYRMNGKPFGLWYAFGRDWIDFVANQMPSGVVDNIYEVVLNPTRLLVVKDQKTVEEIEKEFAVLSGFKNHGWSSDDKYGMFGGIKKVGWGIGTSKNPNGPGYVTTEHPRLLNWEQMRQAYDGIELYPEKIEAAWSEDWTVDSGCIWNKQGIKTLKTLGRYDPVSSRYVV